MSLFTTRKNIITAISTVTAKKAQYAERLKIRKKYRAICRIITKVIIVNLLNISLKIFMCQNS